MYQEDPEDGLFIVNHMLEQLAEFHKGVIKQYVENDQAQNASVWAYDLSVIETARNMLKDVAL